MIPGVHHTWAFVELFYTLSALGYSDDWYAFDVFSKEHDTVRTFEAALALTRKLEEIAGRIEPSAMAPLMLSRDPAKTMSYLYGLLT
jgi:hypothetical protein